MMIKKIILLFIFNLILYATPQWSINQANNWYSQQGWLVGCNFIPSTAVNELEMWQAETFDPNTINRELGLAESLGFNILRVFLHYQAWGEDKKGFIQRMNDFLNMTNNHHMKVTFVFFDDCWKQYPHVGQQPAPIPGVHNSQWMQCPGDMPELKHIFGGYKAYVQEILQAFANDARVIFWDLFNEPGNSGHENKTYPMLKEVFEWAREVNIIQPITSCWWTNNEWAIDLNKFVFDNSDIITFHSYCDPDCFQQRYMQMRQYGRPVLCTEYMARPLQSTFQNHLPIMKQNNIAGINWGNVFGKTQTVYPWGSKEGSPVPEIWFHDIFWNDTRPFQVSEVEFIRNITGVTYSKNIDSEQLN